MLQQKFQNQDAMQSLKGFKHRFAKSLMVVTYVPELSLFLRDLVYKK